MKITITSTDVAEKPWTKGDRSGLIRTQDAVAESNNRRMPTRLDLGKEKPYPIGEYSCDLEDNWETNNFGDLQLKRRMKLTPIAKPAAARAA